MVQRDSETGLLVGCVPGFPGTHTHKALVMETTAALDAGVLDDLDTYIALDHVRHCQATPDAVVGSLDDFKAVLPEAAYC